MDNENIFVIQPNLPPLDEFIPYLEQIWHKKILTNNGPFHQELEHALCDYLDVPYISLMNNGTNALLIALQSLKLEGEVITTPFTFVATSNSLIWNNLKPVFVDIDPCTLNINPDRIEAAITDKTTALLPVHCYGNPCDIKAIQSIADKYGLKVIYDAAHAFGVQLHEDNLLHYGSLSVLSFHATKVFNTFEGGAVICHNKDMKNNIDLLKNFGIVDEINGSIAPGINGKMNELQAAFGLLQLKTIDGLLAKRKEIDQQYRDALLDIPGLKAITKENTKKSNYAYFPILIENNYPLTRDEVYEMLKKCGIYSRRYFYPLISNLALYAELDSAHPDNLPIANQIAKKILCLPIYPDLTKTNVEKIINLLRRPK